MPKISSLSTSINLQSTDILVGTDVSDSNKSKNFTLNDLAAFINTTANGTGTIGYVPRFNSSTTVEDSPLFSSGDRIGLGTTSPGSKLHILSEDDSSNPIIKLEQSGSGDSGIEFKVTGNLWRIGIDNDNYDVLTFARGGFGTGLTTMVLKSNKVGIDNISPQHTLDVGGDIHTNSELRITGTSDTAAISYDDATGLSITPPNTKPVIIGTTGSSTGANILVVEGNTSTNKLLLKPIASVDSASIEYSPNDDRLYLTPQDDDSVMVGSETTNADLIVKGDTKSDAYSVSSSLNTAPASASATGTAGDIRFAADYIYLCVAANTWKRVAIATWS
jgi:hypothetical protein